MKNILFLVIFTSILFSQWTKNIKENTLVVTNNSEPYNIVLNKDASDGFYITWQENTSNIENILTLHYTKDLQPDFRTDGILVSSSMISKKNFRTESIANDLFISWIEEDEQGLSSIFIQRITPKGKLLLGEKGKSITNDFNFLDNALAKDKSNNFHIVGLNSDNKLILYTLNSRGELITEKSNIQISKSNNLKSKITIIPDNEGGIYILWLENTGIDNKLMGQYINSSGNISWTRSSWKKDPFTITNLEKNVFTYKAEISENNNLFVVSEVIYENQHRVTYRVFNNLGLNTIPNNSILITNNIAANPILFYKDNLFFLSYLEKEQNYYNLTLKVFEQNGKEIKFNTNKILSFIKDDSFAYTTISDNSGGIYIFWVTNQNNTDFIKAQRVNDLGKVLWDTNGVLVSSRPKSLKSYFIPFYINNKATIIFKDTKSNSSQIYAQRLIEPNTNYFDFTNFTAYNQNNDNILEWSTTGEENSKGFIIEKSFNNGEWIPLGFVQSFNNPANSEYSFTDKNVQNGLHKYRIKWLNIFNDKIYSSIVQVKVGTDNFTDFTLFQNEPNPASTKTNIKFYAPYSTKVTITIYQDLKPIKQIYNDYCNVGENNISLDLNDFDDGVYVIQMKTNNYSEIKKMVVQK